jgi:CheY-like chemotaxis protein
MRVLLVEDEADVRRYFVRALTGLRPSLEIIEAADGREALDYFLHESFDLVLSDQRMPCMSGLELLRAVRAVSPVPFLIISADRSAEREAMASGVNEFLSKPISLAALRAAVARYL